jgi:ribosomal protein S20
MRIKLQLITTCLVLMTVIGCAAGVVKQRVTTPASDQYTLYARGVSEGLMKENLSERAAQASARNELATSIQTHIKSLTKSAAEQIGLGKDAELNTMFSEAIKQTVDQVMSFSSVHEGPVTTEKKGIFRSEVVVKLELGPVNQEMMENLKERKRLYERFRTSNLFKELESEIDSESSGQPE